MFAGFGIKAEAYNFNDYSNLNVKDKIVIVLMGEPESDNTSYFNGIKPTKYSSTRIKTITAKEEGAKAILFTPSAFTMEHWQDYINYLSSPKMVLPTEEEKNRKSFYSFLLLK